MKANEFIRKERQGLKIFKHALAQLSFKPKMFLVVYQYECEFVNEIKPNHGNCVFAYSDVKRLIESHELVEQYNGLFEAKELIRVSPKMTSELRELAAAIADVESCQKLEGE